ncbi:MAG: hypothetical protein DRN15_01225 [Thermoprotei archaeon]|nr:MAG: hypothetical protein DRN15_01225 [Thermoprotei archaeon]RLF25804.1 MAG: hypothetical protein DRM97_00590 [Thermoprotei archaeon]
MKAVVLAGGFATRLRPLSCTRPKQLFPVVNRPLLDRVIERLVDHGVDEVILALHYMAEKIMLRYQNEFFSDIRIICIKEDRPLGTAGPLKLATRYLDKEPFLVLNGDILTFINYRDLYEHHLKCGGLATIAVKKVEDVSRYGVVELDERWRVMRFIEKPKGEVKSKMINAGIYVLDPKVLDMIPPGRKVMLEEELFPKLARDGQLYAYRYDGVWVDIGKPNDYLRANEKLLEVEAKPHNGVIMGREVIVKKGAELIPPVAIGDYVVIEEGSRVGPYACLGSRCFIGKGCMITDSVLFEGVHVGDYSAIKGAIIGENVTIGRWVKIERGCLIGDGAVVRDEVTLTQGVAVCPYKEVKESILTPCILK